MRNDAPTHGRFRMIWGATSPPRCTTGIERPRHAEEPLTDQHAAIMEYYRAYQHRWATGKHSKRKR